MVNPFLISLDDLSKVVIGNNSISTGQEAAHTYNKAQM